MAARSPTSPKTNPAIKDAHKKGTDAFEISTNDYLTTEAPTSAHIWLTSADSGTPRRLTQGRWSLPISFPPGPPSSPISWSNDGRSIAFTRQQRPYPGETEKTVVQLLDVATGAIRPLTSHKVVEAFPQWSPDGTRIGYLYGRDGDVVNVADAYLTTPSGGDGANLTRGLDRMFYRILWMPDSKSFIVGANDVDRVSLWQVPVSGAPRKLDLGGISPSNGFWLDVNVGQTGAIAFTGSDAGHPAELFYMSSATSAPKRLTSFNTHIAALTLGRADTFDWKGPDNFAENGVVTYPPGFDANRKYPVILLIHGGPNSASLLTFSAASQAMAGRGYIVFSPNYRGSDNFGNAYYRAVVKNAGDGPGRDVMAGLAVLKRRPYVDSTRIFVTGTSYGGYMTSWLIGHYGGWKAAVAGAAVTDPCRPVQLRRRQRGLELLHRWLAVDRGGREAHARAVAHHLRAQHEDADAHHVHHGRRPRPGHAIVQALSRAQRSRCRDEVHCLSGGWTWAGRSRAPDELVRSLDRVDRAARQQAGAVGPYEA